MSKIYSVYLLKYLSRISKSLRGKNKKCEEKSLMTGVAKGTETEILLNQMELQNLETRAPCLGGSVAEPLALA